MTSRIPWSKSLSLLLPVALCLAASSCQRNAPPAASAPSAAEFVKASDARVKVLLLGVEGGSGTKTITPLLEQFSGTCPDGVLVARIEVPPPGKAAPPPPTGLAPTLKVAVDNDRALADSLEFFFYPTLYVLDAEGAVRYQGTWEDADLPGMVAEILAEKPGEPGKRFTAPMVPVGDTVKMPACAGLDGVERPFAELQGAQLTLLLFGRTTCPYSVDAAAALPGLAAPFADRGLAAVVVNFGQAADDIRTLYAEKAPGIPVLVDPERKISKDLFGVTGAPYFYLLDSALKVVAHAPFTVGAAQNVVNGALGQPAKPATPAAPPPAAGGG